MAAAVNRRDWAALTSDQRAAALELCWRRAGAEQDRLGAFAEVGPDRPVSGSGALAGLPYAAKDLFAAAGRRPGCGLPTPPDFGTGAEATVLARLDAAGAVRIGFTRMTALAYEPSGVGTVRNPLDPAFVPGGSSSGSAVAVATGTAAIALGSDTGGSVRIPAQCCGVAAWKPSAGLVPDDGTMPLSPSLDTIGVIGRNIRDIAAVAAVLTDGAMARVDDRVRTVAVAGDALSAAEAPVAVACRETLARLPDVGVTAETVDVLDMLRELGEEALVVMQAEAWRIWGPVLDRIGDPVLVKRIAKGGSIGADRLVRSLDARDRHRVAFEERAFAGADLLALPVMPIRTPLVAEVDPASSGFTPRLLYALSAYTRFVNYLGLPALALPAGGDDRGMPVALQLVGRRGDDAGLLAFGARLQAMAPWGPPGTLPFQTRG